MFKIEYGRDGVAKCERVADRLVPRVRPVQAKWNDTLVSVPGNPEVFLGEKTAKRRFPRVALPKGMLVAWQHVGGRSVSRVATLGLGGLFISTREPAAVGTLVKIVFDVPGGEVRARATVKNTKPGKGMAVAFIEMGYGDRARLDQLLKRLLS